MAATSPALQGSPNPVRFVQGPEKNQFFSEINSAIAARAFELFQADGNHGNDETHWFQAESELLGRHPHDLQIQDSKSWFNVSLALAKADPESIRISLDPCYAVLAYRSQPDPTGQAFLRVDFPAATNPSTASGYFKNERLTLMVQKASPQQQELEHPTPGTSVAERDAALRK